MSIYALTLQTLSNRRTEITEFAMGVAWSSMEAAMDAEKCCLRNL
jgi:hypothetical protein